MRDKFRKTSNRPSSGKLDSRNVADGDRPRGREKDRNPRLLRRSHSRSPKRTRLLPPLPTVRGREDPRYRFEPEVRPRPVEGKNRLEYDAGRKGKSTDSQVRLRMDNQNRGYEADRSRKYADVPPERNSGVKDGADRNAGVKKGAVNFELDRVMKRAREERSSFWNKKVIEAEEKDPQRWGHSGFKELYRRDMRRSRSVSPFKTSFSKRRAPLEHPHPLRRSRSRSRSPIMKGAGTSRPRSTRDLSPLMSRRTHPPGAKLKPVSNKGPLISNSPMSLLRDRKKENGFTTKSRPGSEKLGLLPKPTMANKSRSSIQALKSKPGLKRGLDAGKKLHTRNSRSKSSSGSISSDSLGSSSPYLPPSNRSSGSKHDLTFQSKGSRKRSHSRSISRSSSSSTSSDDDVLQLHPKSKGRSRSLSYSDSSSSDSGSSASVKLSSRNKPAARTSSSSSSRSSSSDYDAEKRRKIQEKGKKISSAPKKVGAPNAVPRKSKQELIRRKGPKNLGPSDIDSNSSSSGVEEVAVAPKPKSSNPKPPPTSAAPPAKPEASNAPKGSAPPKTANKEKNNPPSKSGAASQSGESDSDSDSSSDSQDSEPKMTLSERFAKLTQMSTDKREYAKPVLSVNEIDTKLKVVKDLRNADTKVYVDGQPAPANYPPRGRVRPKSPDYAEGEKRYTSDERRRHFEKMSKDEPTDRPADWSDTRVRYYYYRDRGYFNDRPLSLEEYVKWEEWWYKYRDWLQNEGLLNRMNQGQGHYSGNNHPHAHAHAGNNGGNWNHGPGQMDNQSRPRPYNNAMSSRRVERMPAPLLSNRPNFGRPEGNAYLQNQIPIGRRIGRTPAGSLVVNIRQGNNFQPRDKRVALNRPR